MEFTDYATQFMLIHLHMTSIKLVLQILYSHLISDQKHVAKMLSEKPKYQRKKKLHHIAESANSL